MVSKDKLEDGPGAVRGRPFGETGNVQRSDSQRGPRPRRSSPSGDTPPREPIDPRIGARTEKLRLDQFLKYLSWVGTGGEAKVRIQSGEVLVNGEVETRRGRGLRPGDVVGFAGREAVVDPALFERNPD